MTGVPTTHTAIDPDSFRALVQAAVRPLTATTIGLTEAGGRVLAECVSASGDLPPFDHSAMDGFAVRAADVERASGAAPVILPIVTTVAAGQRADFTCEKGTVVRIMTGAPLPEGADAVVMVEDTEPRGTESVAISRAPRAGQHIRRRGEAVHQGDLVLEAGTRLGPAQLSVLAAVGVDPVPVYAQPRVAVLSTGDELVPVCQEPGPGQIRDSNRYGLIGAISAAGGVPIDLGWVGDDPTAVEARVRRGLETADCLLTTGGVSVGDFDHTRHILTQFGDVQAYQVAMKPGKPQVFGVAEGRLIFGLPGNPVSSLVVFDQFVRPALGVMGGVPAPDRPRFGAILDHSITKAAGKTHYMRAILEVRAGRWHARLAGAQDSGNLASATRANGLCIVDAETTQLDAGEVVTVELWS